MVKDISQAFICALTDEMERHGTPASRLNEIVNGVMRDLDPERDKVSQKTDQGERIDTSTVPGQGCC